jgi:peptidoglycan LD-endopeptidase CwlK
MINSRDIAELHPIVQGMCKEHLKECKEHGIDLIITSTYRDDESQKALFNQGRYGNPGKIVTNARPGESFHNWRCAYDVVPIVNGKPVWSTTGDSLKLWQQVGILGKLCGLEWAGDWKTFKEYPHFQWTNGLTIADFQAGKKLPDTKG